MFKCVLGMVLVHKYVKVTPAIKPYPCKRKIALHIYPLWPRAIKR